MGEQLNFTTLNKNGIMRIPVFSVAANGSKALLKLAGKSVAKTVQFLI
jgi:hypothetical protein